MKNVQLCFYANNILFIKSETTLIFAKSNYCASPHQLFLKVEQLATLLSSTHSLSNTNGNSYACMKRYLHPRFSV